MYPLYVCTTCQKCFSPKFPVWRGTEELFRCGRGKRLVFIIEKVSYLVSKVRSWRGYISGRSFYQFSGTQVRSMDFTSKFTSCTRSEARQTDRFLPPIDAHLPPLVIFTLSFIFNATLFLFFSFFFFFFFFWSRTIVTVSPAYDVRNGENRFAIL